MHNILPIIGLGFLLGIRHATDPDHIVAISTILSKNQRARAAAWIGALWGAGHTFTIFIVGGLIILFQVTIPPRLGLGMEAAVSVMLIILGLSNIRAKKCSTCRGTGILPNMASYLSMDEIDVSWTPCEVCAGSGKEIFRPTHSHDYDSSVFWRPLIIGLVHGLAGSAAVALLVLTSISDPAWAMSYLLIFGVGTIAGMVILTSALTIPLRAARKSLRVCKFLNFAINSFSILFGCWLFYFLAIKSGFFTANIRWIPK